jgi:hypothetical protein
VGCGAATFAGEDLDWRVGCKSHKYRPGTLANAADAVRKEAPSAYLGAKKASSLIGRADSHQRGREAGVGRRFRAFQGA